MKPRLLKPEPLTAEAFAPHGDVIEMSGYAAKTINYGHTEKFPDLARLDLIKDNGRPQLHIFRSKPLPLPIAVKVMERHPLSSQAFYPLNARPYLVVVAGRGDFNPENLKAFIAAPAQGVNYHAGTWHHYSLALEAPSDFLVIDRAGPEKNCDEVFLDDDVRIDY
jgi:ureidoglycolate lyase